MGDRFALKGPTLGAVEVVVTGLYEPLDAGSPLWAAHPDLLGEVPTPPRPPRSAAWRLLLSDASLPDMQLGIPKQAVETIVRFPAQPDDLLATDTDEIERAVVQLRADPTVLTGSDGYTPAVTTGLGTVLRAADARLLAGTAQASVLLIGLATVGALALVLAARLLVVRRETFLLAERARGASVASVVVRALRGERPARRARRRGRRAGRVAARARRPRVVDGRRRRRRGRRGGAGDRGRSRGPRRVDRAPAARQPGGPGAARCAAGASAA